MRRTVSKILLLNPPGKHQYFRDYYCAKLSKARYYYHPVDLVYLSGRLAEMAEIKVLDAIAEKLSPESCEQAIISLKPEAMVFLSSAPSYREDMHFISKLKNSLPDCFMIGTGDIFREYRTRGLRDNPFLDALLTDFSTDDIVRYLSENPTREIPNLIYRKGEQLIEGQEQHTKGIWNVPVPKWDAFNLKAYHFPFARRKPFASILTDFGCPYNCDFCPVSSLGFKLRPVADIIAELKKLKSLGVKELYIRDQTFGVHKKRSMELLDAIMHAKLRFSWTGLSRTDVLDDDLLAKMKKSGCHTLMIGIESANDLLMTEHKKNIQVSDTYASIKEIKKAGIRVGGFFMMGFPGESRESMEATAQLARRLPIDYASFNIVSPRFGTEFRQKAIEEGAVNPENLEAESSAAMPVWKNQKLSNTELLNLRRKTVKKFYMRLSYIIRRLLAIRTFNELINLFSEGWSLLKKNK